MRIGTGGKAPRRPPLIWAARDALIAIAPRLAGINDQIMSPTEAALRCFVSPGQNHRLLTSLRLFKSVSFVAS